MSVSTTNSTQTFAGGQSVLTFNFRALTSFPQYIQVSAVALTGRTVTALSYGTQYTVTISSTGVGGTVIVSPTFGTNYNYVVYRNTAILQSSSYTDYNAFPASTLENNLDQLTMVEQERSTYQSLNLSYPIGTSTTYSTTFPLPSIGTVVGSDPTGTFFLNLPPGPTGATGAQGPVGPSGSTISVSSSTTDVTVITSGTTYIISAVNAATGGTNTILRLDGSGNIPPLSAINLKNIFSSITIYGSSLSTGTLLSSSSIRIFYGTTPAATQATITFSPSFSSISSYVVLPNIASALARSIGITQTSNSQCILFNEGGSDSISINWIAFGY